MKQRFILNKMPYKCVAFGCKSGYLTNSNDDLTFHCFPKDNDIAKKWINRICRKDFVASKNSVLCSLHFTEEDFVTQSTDCNVTRKKKFGSERTIVRRRLKVGAVPSNFPNLPTYFKSVEKSRATTSTSSHRLLMENERLEKCEEDFFKVERISSFDDIKRLINISKNMPSGFVITEKNENLYFLRLHFSAEFGQPFLCSSLMVKPTMEFCLFHKDAKINSVVYNHIVSDSFLSDIAQLFNLLAFINNLDYTEEVPNSACPRTMAITNLKVSLLFTYVLHFKTDN